MSRIFLLIALTMLLPLAQADEFNDKIDSVFSVIDDASAPGCSVGVIVDGELVHQKGYGLANLELDIPLDGNNVHRIGSVSKQFTAMAVLLLAEEGKLDLNADIHRYLPELISYDSTVTINAMLGHISGMADYDYISGGEEGDVDGGLNIKSVAGGPFRIGNEDYLTIDEFYDVVKQASLRHPPNQEFAYSNLAYFLLSMLVEEVSGESLREYAHRRIFEPLEMTETFFSDDPVEIVKNRASGYRPEGDSYITDMTNLFWVGDGGLHTTVGDLAKWDKHFYSPSIGNNPEQLMAQFLTPNSDLPAFSENSLYANGQAIEEVAGRQRVFHGGGWLGVTTFYARYPQERYSTIILCNDVSLNPYGFSEAIDKLYFSE